MSQFLVLSLLDGFSLLFSASSWSSGHGLCDLWLSSGTALSWALDFCWLAWSLMKQWMSPKVVVSWIYVVVCYWLRQRPQGCFICIFRRRKLSRSYRK